MAILFFTNGMKVRFNRINVESIAIEFVIMKMI